MSIKPGSLASFSDSMAAAIEEELNQLMKDDKLPELNMDASDPTVRDRRRFFVAIARGVVKHLENRKDAIKVFCEHNETKPVTALNVDFS